MIQVNELRLGNYFFIGGLDRYVKVSSVFLSHFKCTDENGIDFNNHQNNIKPIELTEEILLKCGFEEKNSILEKDGIRLFKIRDLYFRGNFPIKADVRYLHQLQNLYYSLIGQELEIKL